MARTRLCALAVALCAGTGLAAASWASPGASATGGPAGHRGSMRAAVRFTISFAGDVHFTGRVARRLRRDPATVFAQARPGLRRADLTMVNLETAITSGPGTPQPKTYTFHAPPVAFTALRDAGIDVVTMANNHAADYGNGGIRDTLRAIKARHFPVVGFGRDESAAFAPYRVTLNGVRVAIFAADQVRDETTLRLFSAGPHKPGVANAYSHRLVHVVQRAHDHGYVVVVYLHWGIEHDTCPSHEQRSLASRLATAGAAAVVGTHAHALQGAGWRPHGAYVEYGLGNFLWYVSHGTEEDDSGVLTLTFAGGRVVANSFAPAHIDRRGVPVPSTGHQRRHIRHEWRGDRACTGLAASPPG